MTQNNSPLCENIVTLVQSVLTEDLLSPKWRKLKGRHPLSGQCYIASEACYWLLGGKASGYVPCVLRLDEQRTHWFLRNGAEVLDPTAEQFPIPVPYHLGRGNGFLTKKPSRRARLVMARVRRLNCIR